MWGCLVLLLVGLYLVAGPIVYLSQWHVTADGNTALAEALRWRAGSLSMSEDSRHHEVAQVNGKRYNVVGLAFVFISLVGTLVSDGVGAAPGSFYAPFYVACVALSLPFVGFFAFRRVTGDSVWTAVLTGYLICGTSLLPIVEFCRWGDIYSINHVLAVVGLLLFAADLLGTRRVWPAVIGLALAAWSRQLTALYALPLLWIAWRQMRGFGNMTPIGVVNPTPRVAAVPVAVAREDVIPRQSPSAGVHRRRFWFALAGVGLIAVVPMSLNTLKFGNPFDTGYPRMYEGRTDWIAKRARAAFMGLRYVPEHAWAMNVEYPAWDIRRGTLYAVRDDTIGGSIWLTSPLLFAVFLTASRWWRDPARRVLMLSTLPVIFGLMCYHTTGANQSLYYRYSLDFIPIWLMVVAPYTRGARATALTLASLAYSALYFRLIA